MAAFCPKDHQERLKTLLYHKDIPPEIAEEMTRLRQLYVDLAVTILEDIPGETRSKSLALTHLEDSLFRTIQALALHGTPDVEE